MLTNEAVKRLQEATIIWMATVRPDGRPHLVPVWFFFGEGKIFACVDPQSVKARNLRANPRASVALEEGKHPIICEGQAEFLDRPWPESVIHGFAAKYEWDISTEEQYTGLVQVTPAKWMTW